MEQFVRDARIAQIYEGTNGIQALDLVGRKLGKDNGRAIQAFFRIVGEEAAAAKADPELAALASGLERANGDLQTATLWLMQNGLANPNNAGAAAYPYMNLMGVVCLGLMWLRMAKASQAALAGGTGNETFHRNKLATARFYADRILPESNVHRRKVEAGAESLMALPEEAFY